MSDTLQPNKLVSMESALTDFIRFMRHERQAAKLTLEAYERDLLRSIEALEQQAHDLVLAHVTPEDVRAHMHRLIERKLAKPTVRRALYAVGSFFGWAVRWGLVPTNPVDRITIPRRERLRDVRALTKRERGIVTAAADRLAKKSRRVLDAQAPLLVRLMLKTGLRRSEVVALTWRDIDLENGEILVRRGKGGKSHRVPIEDRDVIGRLKEVCQKRQVNLRANELPHVFLNTRGGKLAYSTFYKVFHRVWGIKEVSPARFSPLPAPRPPQPLFPAPSLPRRAIVGPRFELGAS